MASLRQPSKVLRSNGRVAGPPVNAGWDGWHTGAASTLIIGTAIGVPLDSSPVAIISMLCILLFGLPHGTLDLALLRRANSNHNGIAVAALYLGCAAAMYLLWLVTPSLALLLFLGLSIAHFAEDWTDLLPPVFAGGTAVALISAPALVHHAALVPLFGTLVSPADAAVFADIALLVAPVALVTAAVGVMTMIAAGAIARAASTFAALLGLLILPPVIGFALFFCLLHSPGQFAKGLTALGWRDPAQWRWVVLPTMAAACGIAAAIYVQMARGTVSQSMIAMTFITLSVLTVPHLIMPTLVRRLTGATPQMS